MKHPHRQVDIDTITTLNGEAKRPFELVGVRDPTPLVPLS